MVEWVQKLNRPDGSGIRAIFTVYLSLDCNTTLTPLEPLAKSPQESIFNELDVSSAQ
jgi:hypothetical protein